jgi:hypothetical protein
MGRDSTVNSRRHAAVDGETIRFSSRAASAFPLLQREIKGGVMRRFVGLAALVFWGCAEGIPPEPPAGPPDNGGSTTPPGSAPSQPLGTFHLDYFYLPSEADYAGAANTPLADASCNTLATVPGAFAFDIVNVGAGRLSDGRVLIYSGQPCFCQQTPFCFSVASSAWGFGTSGRPLSPFRSIAVDSPMVTMGMKVYAPDLAGKTMPGDPPAGGFVHDGCLVVDDGGANHMRVDFFTGTKALYQSVSRELGVDLQLYPAAGHCP